MSKDLNTVTLIGRLTRDANKKVSSNGEVFFFNFALAVNDVKKQGDKYVDEPNYFDCKYSTRNERLGGFLLKGKQVCVHGALKQERWEDNNGENRSKVVVNVYDLILLSSATQNPAEKPVQNSSIVDDDDDYIPF